jgi:hypothetical protein
MYGGIEGWIHSSGRSVGRYRVVDLAVDGRRCRGWVRKHRVRACVKRTLIII